MMLNSFCLCGLRSDCLSFMLLLKAVQQKEKWTKKSNRVALWKKAHERNAERLLSLIISLEGLWVKLGQYLSTRADVLPTAYIVCLKQLQDSLPPRPINEVIVCLAVNLCVLLKGDINRLNRYVLLGCRRINQVICFR